MKKLNLSIRSLFTLCLAAISVTASAQQVSQQEAANIALQFLKGNDSHNARLRKATPEALKLVYTEPSAKDRTPNLYIYNMEGGGFAIVSGDARTGSQILGYSFDNNFSAKGMPENVKYWLGEYSRQIDFIKAHQPEVSESKRREGLKKEGEPTPPTIATTVVAPLLKTTWGQGAPYNGMTPTLKNEQQQDQNTVTGCVATAMAQIMNYWKWPAQGKGKHTYYWVGDRKYLSSDFSKNEYDWKNMADPYDETLPYNSSNENMSAVAQLMYDCGVAVDMDYGLKASGAYDEDVVPALTSYFGYSHNISLKHQSEFENDDAGWIKLLTDELDASRPVYYAAEDATENDDDAHAFVLDGYGTYNSTTYFHINWGWDGYDGFGNKDTANGYFAMNFFNPWYRESLYTEGEHEGEPEIDRYNQNSVAIVGIQPAEDSELTFENLADGWDKDGNWDTIEGDFGTGTGLWIDLTAYSYPGKTINFTREQNKIYKDIYRITLKGSPTDNEKQNWDDFADLPKIETRKVNLIFYWNSETNECYLPTQYTNLQKPYTTPAHYYYYVNNDYSIGRYDPMKEQFTVKFNVYELSTAIDTDYEWSSDPEGLFQSLMAAYSGNEGFTYGNTKYICTRTENPSLGTISYEISSQDASFKNYTYTFNISNLEATLTLAPQAEVEHKGLYLGNFTEQNDGTATQVAGFIPVERHEEVDEEGEKYFWYEPELIGQNYRIGMMQVTEKTSKTDIIEFAKSLKEKGDNGEKTYNVPCSLRTADEDDEPVEFSITEGAYYVVVAHYNDNNNFTSYEYMPVFFSKEENWEEIGECYYRDDIVGGMYSLLENENYVPVQEYKGGELIKNVGDRIYRIEDPYLEENDFDHSDEDEEDNHRKDCRGTSDTDRKGVYLYLYVDADNNVSLYPDYFEYQPLGIDWGYGEMMVKQNFTGLFENDEQGFHIIFNHGSCYYDETDVCHASNEDFDLMEYFDNIDMGTNYDYVEGGESDDRFLLKLPADYTPKNYLTLHDDEPYTLDNPRQDYNEVSYSRELDSNNNWGTLMLPFKFNTEDIDDDFSFYELTKIETNGDKTSALVFTQISEDETVDPNTPVIFKRDAGSEKNLEVSGVVESDGFVDLVGCGETGIFYNTISNLNDNKNWSFIGVYNSGAIRAPKDPSAYNELTKCYFFEDDCILNVNEAMYLYQYRGYFRDNSTTTGGGAKRIPVRFDDEEYTSLDALFNGEQPVKKYGKGRFNLQGQAVGKDYKGVVIEDGRKTIRY